MLKSKTKNNLIINNAIELGELTTEANGKGRKFTSRFIEAGVAHYEQFGDVLITKETLDKFIQTMVGCPVIIKHKDITDKNADKERVGVVSRVWYNEADGWFWCEGVIWDKQAIGLVKNQGWNVSCTYDFESDFKKSTYHGKEIDMEFTGGEFLHLALVPNPRYERATIVMNSQDDAETVFLSGLKTIIENALDKGLSDEDRTVLNGLAEIFEGENGLGESVNNSDKEFIMVGEGNDKHPIPIEYVEETAKNMPRNLKIDELNIVEFTAKDINDYKEYGSVKEYYLNNIKGKSIEHSDSRLGKVYFDDDGIGESIKINRPKNLFIVTKAIELVKEGKYDREEENKHKREDDIVKFHVLYTKAKLPYKTRILEIKIAEKENGKKYYFLRPVKTIKNSIEYSAIAKDVKNDNSSLLNNDATIIMYDF